jgi:hypothetical protein
VFASEILAEGWRWELQPKERLRDADFIYSVRQSPKGSWSLKGRVIVRNDSLPVGENARARDQK